MSCLSHACMTPSNSPNVLALGVHVIPRSAPLPQAEDGGVLTALPVASAALGCLPSPSLMSLPTMQPHFSPHATLLAPRFRPPCSPISAPMQPSLHPSPLPPHSPTPSLPLPSRHPSPHRPRPGGHAWFIPIGQVIGERCPVIPHAVIAKPPCAKYRDLNEAVRQGLGNKSESALLHLVTQCTRGGERATLHTSVHANTASSAENGHFSSRKK